MDYHAALAKMKQGFDVKIPGESNYYAWDYLQNVVLVHSPKDIVLYSLQEKDFPDVGLLRTDWRVRNPQIPKEEPDFPEWWENVDFQPEEPHVLKRGDEGDDVSALQEALSQQGMSIGKPDGVFGPGTERAVKQFQKTVGLVEDGIFGDKTAIRLEGRDFPEALSQADMALGANKLGCRVEAIMAVSFVESRGFGFLASARPKILYERHVMRRRLITHDIDPQPYIVDYPNIVNIRTGGYKGGEAEFDRLDKAQSIHQVSGSESASWGAYQIMGYHWSVLGYVSVQDFVKRMYANEAEHLDSFVRFILNDNRLLKATQGDNPDFTTFARIYNGPAYAKNAYDTKMLNQFQNLIEGT